MFNSEGRYMAAQADQCFLLSTLRAICMAAQICCFWLQARVATLIFPPGVNYGLDVMLQLDTRTYTHVPLLQW